MSFFHNDYAGKRCAFHLKNGTSYYGVVTDDINDLIELEELRTKVQRVFHKNMIGDCVYLDSPDGLRIAQQRSGLITSARTPIYNNRKFKKLIILGAGASSDTGNDVSIPTTDGLFHENDYLKFFEGADALKYKILAAIRNGRTLEDFFEEQWLSIEKSGDTLQLQRLINTQYYLQLVIHSASAKSLTQTEGNYFRLIDLIDEYLKRAQDESVAIVTFNYDTFLEHALDKVANCRYKDSRSYLYQTRNGREDHNRILLFKPHGSWNWIYNFDMRLLRTERHRIKGAQSFAKKIYESGLTTYDILKNVGMDISKTDIPLQEIQTLLSDRMKIVDHNYEFDKPYYPNLLIPFKQKDHFVMPRLHTAKLEAILPHVEEIITIGWKGTENEFNSLLGMKLKKKKLDIQFITQKSKSVETELKKYLDNATFHDNHGGFSNWLDRVSTGGKTDKLFLNN